MASRIRSRTQRPPFKACRRCKFLVPHEEEKCPKCGSTDFTDEWEGMILVVDINNSKIAEMLGIKEPGKYAIKIR